MENRMRRRKDRSVDDMQEQEGREQKDELKKWAKMSDTEFLFRYLGDASEEEVAEFLEMVPEFMEDIS